MYMYTHTQTAKKIEIYQPTQKWVCWSGEFWLWLTVLSDWWLLSVCLLKAKQSLATLTKDVPKRHSLAMPTEAVVNGNNQEWVMQADLPLTAAIRQSQQTLYVHTGHPADRQGKPARSTNNTFILHMSWLTWGGLTIIYPLHAHVNLLHTHSLLPSA